jgi:cbb3-type cytochrome oxidase subunit 3
LSGFNLGDALFQLFSLAFIVLIIALIVSLFRSNKKRKNQFDRIEKKIDDINQRITKGYNE